MDIVVSTDNNYVMPLCIMLESLIANNSSEIIVHIIIDESVTDNSKHQIEKVIKKSPLSQVFFYLVREDLMDSYPGIGRFSRYISKASYYRLFVAELLPSAVDKVLYLDCDVIIRHPIQELWNTQIDDVAIGAVPDMFDGHISIFNRLMYPYQYGYFNAGVLLINLKYWREHDLSERFVSFIKNYSYRIQAHDQDVLNATLYAEKKRLPLTYNFQAGFLFESKYLSIDYQKYCDELESTIENPVVIHFTDSPKPWEKGCKNPYQKEFIYYLNVSPFKGILLRRRKRSAKSYIREVLQYIKVLRPQPSHYRSSIIIKDANSISNCSNL